jgi:hypothetical protein
VEDEAARDSEKDGAAQACRRRGSTSAMKTRTRGAP